MAWKALEAVGGYGYKVTILRRRGSPKLYLRHGSEWRSTAEDIDVARADAREWSADLLAGRESGKRTPTLGELFRAYRSAVTPLKGAPQQKEDRRRIRIWLHVLGAEFNPLELTGTQLRHFERDRAEGTLIVPELELRKARKKTIREDLAFLRAVFGWAASMDGGWLLDRNPTAGYKLPREINRRTPRAYDEHYVAVSNVAKKVHPLFGPFMALIESLGWRVSAICQLLVSDFDRTRSPRHPHGRLLKRAESDKVGVERWVVVSADTRQALEAAVRRTRRIGSVYLFPAERADGPWTRHFARQLLTEAYVLAGVPEVQRVYFHAFRRKWVDERKHLPRSDVAAQGGWLNARTLDIYEQPDDASLLAVAEEPRKLRLGIDL